MKKAESVPCCGRSIRLSSEREWDAKIEASRARIQDPQISAIRENLADYRPSRWVALAAVFLLGFALRIAYINQESVGQDESFSMRVSAWPPREIVRALVADFVHPPLHYFLLHGWFKLFGFGIIQARVLSVLFGALSVVLLYIFAEYLFDLRTALYASLLMAVSQLGIRLGQEPRPYAQLHFLGVASCYLFMRALRERRALYWWGFVASSILMLYTHYYGVFVIASLAIFATIRRRRYELRRAWILGGVGLAVAAYVPWLASGVLRAAANAPKTFSGTAASWHAVHWFTVLAAVNSFNNGKPLGLLASSPWWTYVIGSLLFGVPALLAIKNALFANPRSDASVAIAKSTQVELERQGVEIATILWLFPLCVIIGLGFGLHVQYDVKYVSFCLAPYYLLVARGIAGLPSNALRWCLLALIMVYSGNSLRANYFMQSNADWRDAFVYVEGHRREGDCGVFLPRFFDSPPQWTITQGNRPSPFRVIPVEGLAAGLAGCDRVWAVSWSVADAAWWWQQAEIDGRPLEVMDVKIDEQRYLGVHVSLYSRRNR